MSLKVYRDVNRVRSEVYKLDAICVREDVRSFVPLLEVLFGMIHDNVKRRDYVFRRMYIVARTPRRGCCLE